jgi:putative RNA 2'-phosphotransferase
MTSETTKTSKFLNYILRHKPDAVGIELDSSGWVDVHELLKAANTFGRNISRSELEEVVFTNDKQRFALSPDGRRIRANQGHSIQNIELELKPVDPPEALYHGTVSKFMDSIREAGIQKMNRQHVHLSATIETAITVGSRRGKPIVLFVNAGKMSKDGYKFYLSANGVWLTDTVPWKYVSEESL